MEKVMRLRFWRPLIVAASAAAFSTFACAAAYAAWSHHPTSVNSSSSTPPTPVNGGGTTTTTTTTIPSGFTGTIVLGTSKTIHAYLAGGSGPLGVGKATFLVTNASPPTSSTTTTTVSGNQNGSTTTTNTTVVAAAAPQVTTTTLANPPPTTNQTSIQVNIPGFGPTTVSKPVVTLSPQPPVNGVTTTNLVVTGTITGPVATAISPGSRSVPFSLTETVQTVAVAPVAPTTTTSSSTILLPTSIFPRGAFGAVAQPEQPTSDDVEAEVKAASDGAQAAIAACGIETPSCVADALDAYADALEKLAPRLPPRLRILPAIIRKAAHNIRVAKTPAAAVRAVKQAIAEVHKSISLLRADDAATRQVGTREGTLIAETLQVASNKLEKAVGL
jgi:hypothetical protein